jgi:hypothetical protein
VTVPTPLSKDEANDAARRLDAKLRAVVAAADASLASGLWEPTLILLYATIDAMAWLDRPYGQDDVHADDFIDWVDTYLLPDSGLPCSGADMYGARCGFLHSHTGESKRHRALRIKKLFYHRRHGDRPVGIVQLLMNEKFLPPSIDLDLFSAAFQRATERFRAAIAADESKRVPVYHRVRESYYSEVMYGPGA